MNETLSVIDEHMNDMNTPSVYTNGSKRDTRASGSVYSTQALNRFSYIAGHETDEEEHHAHTEAEVMAWSPGRVAEYLEDHGVEKSHCNMFVEQEISGEVLLAMDQSSIFLKEFDLGSVGRRLKTWHKVRALQDEVKQSVNPPTARSNSDYSVVPGETDPNRNRASTMGSALPRALETSRQSPAAQERSSMMQPGSQDAAANAPERTSAISPLQSMTSMSRSDNLYRPSAQTIRTMQQNRRHSSIDSTSNSIDNSARQGHRKQPSLDQKWQLGQPQINGNGTGHSHTMSAESTTLPKRDSNMLLPSSPTDLDRGYFSANEHESRSRPTKNVLKKGASTTASPMHSRTNSFTAQRGRRSTQSGRVASSDLQRQNSSGSNPAVTQGFFGALNAMGNTFGSMRSITSPQLRTQPLEDQSSPIVTKLEYGDKQATDEPDVTSNEAAPKGVTRSPTSTKLSFFSSNKPRITGLRTISDVVTKTEKSTASPVKEQHDLHSPKAGSSTPSTETTSLDLQKSEAQSRTSQGSQGNLVPPAPATQYRIRPKTKKATSAYTRGLEKKTPADAMEGCDYSGWMKKKSGSLMTTWKSRLFILKGRRLSYYYADSDTEEKGLIDISFHRVLPAHNEALTGLHATLTGAAGTPASPKESSTETTAQQDLKQSPMVEKDDGIFIFKLVPPKSGLSKGVNFTKPTVHYFAVKSRQEGRLWMAALMKATIDRDEEGMVTTTYNQKTISLAKARARRERPPALREDDDGAGAEDAAELDAGDESSSKGLGIGGLGSENTETTAGAEKEKHVEDEGSSAAPSTPATGAESEALNENHRDTAPPTTSD